MSKKSRAKRTKLKVELDDDFDELYDDDIDFNELSRDIHSTEWGDYDYDKSVGNDSRRKIEHRRDMRKLYSELDNWEEFGAGADW